MAIFTVKILLIQEDGLYLHFFESSILAALLPCTPTSLSKHFGLGHVEARWSHSQSLFTDC